MSSFTILKRSRFSPALDSTNNDDVDVHVHGDLLLVDATLDNKLGSDTTIPEVTRTEDMEKKNESKLSCRVLGFYPFPTPPPQGPLGWLLKDTHQAIMVTSTSTLSSARSAKISGSRKYRTKKTTLLMDFMTKGGASHPVWYDEITKWNVFLGGSIEGEVRIKVLGTIQDRRDRIVTAEEKDNSSSRNDGYNNNNRMARLSKDGLELDRESSSSRTRRLMSFVDSYNCEMNLYRNNCRMFAARVEREIERLNLEECAADDNQDWSYLYRMMVADMRCWLRILGAGLLPTLYPLSAILLLYEGCWNL